MNVLSLFDGMSCGQIALNRAGVKYDNYFASEIDKYAMKVACINHPDTIQLGDITKLDCSTLPEIDLIIGGSPCQSFSTAGDCTGFEGKSGLFWEYVRVLNEVKPKYFLLENVKMKKEWEQVITDALGVEPIVINSNLVSAQNRKRCYWTNIPNVDQPKDRGILLKDILNLSIGSDTMGLKVREKYLYLNEDNQPHPFIRCYKNGKIKPGISKSSCLTGGGNSGGNHSDMDVIHSKHFTRRYTVNECERLQTVPVNYTNHVSNTQRYKMLGNGWTVDVITHIFKNIIK